MFRWANEPQRAGFRAAGRDLNLPSGDEIPADQAVTFFIERLPFPELIESSQRVELVCVGEFDGNQGHWLDLEPLLFSAQSGRCQFRASEKHLPNRIVFDRRRLNRDFSTRDVVRFFLILRSVKNFRTDSVVRSVSST